MVFRFFRLVAGSNALRIPGVLGLTAVVLGFPTVVTFVVGLPEDARRLLCGGRYIPRGNPPPGVIL